MSCGLYDDSMMKYFDKELNDIETAQFKQHLKGCVSCSEEFEQLSGILGSIEKDIFIEPPLEFEAQVMGKIADLELAERKKPSVIKILILGMGTILTFLMASALIYSILGISIFKLMSYALSDSPTFANIFESANTAFEGGITSIVEYAKTVLEVGIVLAKAHYYIVILVAVLLFALQWMIVSLIKQNIYRQKQVVQNAR
ncbi:MAG: zf-HC2 domain-containing protein [Clostridia bacterium]|nr:zf-HC2 domain-containing protein [Clostridia bacterium]